MTTTAHPGGSGRRAPGGGRRRFLCVFAVPFCCGVAFGQRISAVRTLPATCRMTNEVTEVRLDVTADPTLSAAIVSEVIPAGWTVSNATWNGDAMPFATTGRTNKWVFGFDVPVASGVLQYQVRVFGATGSFQTVSGSATYSDPTNATVLTTGDTQIAVCRIMDVDRDGMSDEAERIADTNPADPNSRLAFILAGESNGNPVVVWKGGVLATQVVERAFSLLPPVTWSPRWTNRPPTLVTNSFADTPAAPATGCFYRVRAFR